MEPLFKEQNLNGDEIETVVSNYKKDPADRKTLAYYEERLRRLEEYWSVFDATDTKLRALQNVPRDHAYFTNDYYNAILTIFNKYKNHFTSQIELFNKPATKEVIAGTSDNAHNQDATDPKPQRSDDTSAHEERCRTTEIQSNLQQQIIRAIRRQGEVIKALRRLIAGMKMDEDQQNKNYYDLKISRLNQHWLQIENINQNIWELAENPIQMGYNVDEYVQLEEEVQDQLVYLFDKRDKLTTSSTTINHNTMMKLPKIVLPKFDGDYLKWRQFYDLFNQMVHKQSMANCQKMWYLKTNLSGEAERLIRHLTLSDENYTAAWDMLKDRYENSRLLVTALLNKLLSQPVIVNESAIAIKTLHDTTQECLLALKNLKVSTADWDPILMHLLIKKLDQTTHRLYEQSLSHPRNLQSMKSLLSFLENRFQSLEALGSKAKIPGNYHIKQGTTKPFTSAATTIPNCISCKGNHALFSCRDFLRLTPSNRLTLVKKHNLCINCLRPGHSSQQCTLRSCTKCTRKHNTLLHIETYSASSQSLPKVVPPSPMKGEVNDRPTTLTAQTATGQQNYILLSTILVNLVDSKGMSVECRAVLDSGSQINFITERIIKKLGLTGTSQQMQIQGIGQTKQLTQRRVNVLLQSKLNGFATRVEAFVLPQIIAPQPTQEISTDSWAIPKNIKLADPNFNNPSRIDLLLGAEFYHDLLCIGQIKLGETLPTLQNTVFGWIVAGRVGGRYLDKATCGVCSEDEMFDIERFWRLEEVDTTSQTLSPEQARCENYFNQTVKKDPTGRFIVRLPFNQATDKLGESKDIALRRFLSLERRLARHNDVKSQYVEFMNEYIKLGHMQEIDERTIQHPYYFLPHHSVIKSDSLTTKLRVVFDASAKTSTNVSLNDVLATGPTIQDELFSILLRFRLPKFVFTADIEKMYRQVLINEKDRRFQLIIWRSDSNAPLKFYQLNTVTYGTTTAPFLATRCLKRLAQEDGKDYPTASEVIQRDFYVDDVMTGSNCLATAIDTQRQLIALLQKGGFKLRKWCANHPRLLQNISREDTAIQLDFNDEVEEHIKTLGLTWIPKNDVFCIKTNWTKIDRVTKRLISSDIAHLFDPLGIMGPVVVTAKMFLQQLWNLKLDWDAAVPSELHTRWIRFREGLQLLNDIKIPRHVFSQECPRSTQIHAFADASERAYGGAVYIRSVNSHNRIVVRLLCAKSRVAPTKQLTLPRLELCAAKLTAELTKRAIQDIKMEDAVTFYWTDSEIVLAWINSRSSSFQTFVANRIASIHELSSPQQWRHVNSKENPADILSRGIAPERLEGCNLWFYGPPFLHGEESIWPKPYKTDSECELERKRTAIPVTIENSIRHFVYQINHQNSFKKLQRITAYVLRFIDITRNKDKPNLNKSCALTSLELDKALLTIIKIMQEENFKDDLSQLQKLTELNKSSPLISLTPFLDDQGVIRVGGRLEASSLSYDAKHPMLLPYNHPFTKLLMTDIHRNHRHVSPQALLAITRQQFWPIKGKTIARSIVQNCVRCFRSNPKMRTQLMGNLPATRIQPARPFTNSGVDFCGPIWTHFHLRGKKSQKSYVAVFCCFATKAVHLEVVSDLTTNAFIGALKRFMGRRGHCQNLYCDNATNFVGARNQLQELLDSIFADKAREEIETRCSASGIDFHFIPARAPHFGGLWEAAVKSAKYLLQRSLASASLTYEELETVMIEIEAILNSRPITSMSSDPNDFTALTPGHFLIGEPLTASIDPRCEETKISLLKRWKLVTHIKQEFWRRWSREYLNQLQHRVKWKQTCQNVQPGTIVIIQEDNLPALKWPLGRIVKTFKGNDGLVRVADVRTANNTLRRPIHRLAPLPIEDDNEDRSASHDDQDREGQTSKRRNSSKSAYDNSTCSSSEVPKKRTRHTYGSALTTLLLTCMILPIIRGQPIETSPFTPQPGLYFENIGTTNIISNECNLVVYYEMETYWNDFYAIINSTKTLDHLCTQINFLFVLKQTSSCVKLVNQFNRLQEEISTDNELLHAKSKSTRTKRGAVNIIGNVANALFGVLDSEYAAEMSNTIDDIKENESRLITLLKNQTSLIDSTINIMKTDQESVDRKFQEIDDHLDQINLRINNISEGLYQQKAMELFSSLAMELTLMTLNFQKAQSAIIDTITDTHHGRINHMLLSPRQLAQELTIIKAHLPTSLQLPASQDSILQFYRLMTIEGRVVENYVIFRLKLPLVNLEKFELFRVTPIPALINGTLVAINPASEFLAINLHRDQYYPLTKQQQSSCLQTDETIYLCKQLHPIYRRGANISLCEIELFHHREISPTCDLRRTNSDPVWIQLFHPNQWIYAFKEKTTVNIVCGNDVSQMSIEGSGLLKLQANCVIRQEFLTIQGHHIYPTTSKLSYIRVGSIPKPISLDHLPMIQHNAIAYHAKLEELRALQKEVQMQDIRELPNKFHAHHVHHYTVGYLTLSLAIISTIFGIIWRCKTTKSCCKTSKPPKPSPRRVTTPDFRVNIDS